MKPFLYLLALFSMTSIRLPAQSLSVSGRVVATNGNPIGGATITAKGTSNTTLSAASGNFTLVLPGSGAILQVSYVGCATREIAVSNTNPLLITLTPVTTDLDEVVVQAYGTTTRRTATGNIGRVTAAEIEKQPVSNPLAALQGRVPGVLITQSSGIPGSEIRIEIRGRTTLDPSLSRNDPLYVIDNVPFEPGNNNFNQVRSAAGSPINSSVGGLSPMNSINPADIESIEVLKDADATAIYGSRGANGVVLITTKKGRGGKTRFTLNSSFGASGVSRTMEMLNTQQYIAMRREAFANDNRPLTLTTAPDVLSWDTTRYTDLTKLFIGRQAFASFLQASLSGGTANTQFSVSGSYNRQTNVYSASLADKVSAARFTLNHTSTNKKLALQFTGIYSSDRNNLVTTDLTRYINLPPHIKLYDSLGNLNWAEGGVTFSSLNTTNPLVAYRQPYLSVADNLSTNLNISYLLFKGFTLRTSAGYNTFGTNERSQRPRTSLDPYQSTLASSEWASSNSKSYIIEPQAEYHHSLVGGEASLLVGSTFQNRDFSSAALTGTNYTNDLLLGSVAAAGQVAASNAAFNYRYTAVFGRLNWASSGKTYILNLTGRRDASSRFGPDKRTALFGAAGGALIFSNYAFLKQQLPFLSFGKLRASYGITGNDQIGNYKYLDLWNPTTNTYQGVPGFYPASLFNSDYSWEINKKGEAALELGFLKDRILLSGAYYRNRSSNQITNYIIPATTGYENIVRNLPALVENTGLEILLSGKLIRTNHLEWSAAINVTLPKNKLVSFPGLASSSYATTYREGQPLNLILGYDYTGVDPQTGYYSFTDVNKDGAINSKDYLPLGNVNAKWFGGFQNTVSYKGLSLSIFFEFRKQTGQNFLAQISSPAPGAELYNHPTLVLDRWQQPGDIAPIQRWATNFNTAAVTAIARLKTSSGIYGDASYLRCKNVSLSYDLSPALLKRGHLEGVRLFLHAQNLFVVTKYQGADPETQNFYMLPPLRSIVGGLQITL